MKAGLSRIDDGLLFLGPLPITSENWLLLGRPTARLLGGDGIWGAEDEDEEDIEDECEDVDEDEDEAKSRFLVPPLNIALTSSHLWLISSQSWGEKSLRWRRHELKLAASG